MLLNLTTNGRKGRFGVIQSFTVPTTGRYKIKAWGARGGTHSYNYGYKPGTYYGGKGAFKEGIFTLTEGTVLRTVVGHRGGDSVEVKGGQSTNKTAVELGVSVARGAGTGGGGGSFVYTSSNVLLLAAGGGGGASAGYDGVNGQAGPNGTSSVCAYSSHSRSGGTGGFSGECDNKSIYTSGGVGAGWLAWRCETGSDRSGENGGSRHKGWVGGDAGSYNRGTNGGPPPGAVGGFGGGGGGADNPGASGGGGGYSGGGGSKYPRQAGGGGGSYCNGSSCSGASGGNSNDDGMVQIFQLSDEG
ncbi:glycine-rich cell wall structural protein 1.8-like [Acropora millepora]|uniref:glycine-rich cell wall structural protein 1.8-like n=1 Tax=Acropora millepora TaxID=45264 RepID=UPI001CF4DC46|nr:glycine-rich cell wall structural protein 1.8-like [Acropora millepora]